MNKVTEVSKVSKVTKLVKYIRITILGYIINTIYEVPTNIFLEYGRHVVRRRRTYVERTPPCR